MSFWAIIVKIAKIIIEAAKILLEVKRYAGILTSLTRDGLQGFIRSYLVGEIVDVIARVGIPFDKVYYLEQELFDQLDATLDGALESLSEELVSQNLNIDRTQARSEMQSHVRGVRCGTRVANGRNPVRNEETAADPIVLATGEFEWRVTDMVVAGAGIEFAIQRTYRSGATYFGPFGPSWDHTYNRWLTEVNPQMAVVLTGELGEHRYLRHPSFGSPVLNYYTPPNGVHSVLKPDGASSFVILYPQGARDVYESTSQPGLHRITRIVDRFGNYLGFSYDGDGRLQRIYVNSPDRHVTFYYNSDGILALIRDHANRIVNYEYDDYGYLACVTGPHFVGEKQRRIETYAYGVVGDTRKLMSIYGADGQLLVQNEYETSPISEHVGRVVRQLENAGESTFHYENVSDLDDTLASRDRPSLRVWQILRNGHQIEHVLNGSGNELLTVERIVEGPYIRDVVTRRRFNADGHEVGRVDAEGMLMQSLFGRDHRWDLHSGPDMEYEIIDVPESVRLGYGNLLATVTRWRRFPATSAELDPSLWRDSLPATKQADMAEDLIVKFRYDPDSQLIISRSDPRFTKSADPLHSESAGPGDANYNPADPAFVDHQRHLTVFAYSPSPRYELQQIAYPNRTRPSNLDGVSAVTGIRDQVIRYDPKGRPLVQVDIRGYTWFNEYYDASSTPGVGPRDGFLLRQTIPHQDIVLNSGTPDTLEIERLGAWHSEPAMIRSSGIAGERITLTVEGVRAQIDQRSDGTLNLAQNPSVKVTVDGNPATDWDQSTDARYVLDNMAIGTHQVVLEDIDGVPFSVGRVLTHVTNEVHRDLLGRVSRAIDALGNETLREYDAAGNVVSETKGPTGNPSMITYTYDGRGKLTGETRNWNDENGLQRPERAYVRSISYNSHGSVTREVTGPQIGPKRTVSKAYDADDNVRLTTDPSGARTRNEYDAMGRLVRIIKGSCEPYCAITKLSYDLTDARIVETNPRGARHAQGYYDAAGRFHPGLDAGGRPHIETDALGNMVITDHDKLGNPQTTRLFEHRHDNSYALLSRSETDYDEHGDAIRLREVIFEQQILTSDPIGSPDAEFQTAVGNGSVSESTTEWHLDAGGNMIAAIGPDGYAERQRLDARARSQDVSDETGKVVHRVFDGNGNIVRIYTFEPVLDPITLATTHVEVFVQDRSYDILSREVSSTDVLGNTWTYRYDTLGNRTFVQDPLGNIVRYQYNAFGEETRRMRERTTSGIGTGTPIAPAVEERHYDANGRVLTLTDASGKNTEFRYDLLGRLLEQWFEVGPTPPKEFREYDRAGNAVWIKRRSGLVLRLGYDLLNRHTSTVVDSVLVGPGDQLDPATPTFEVFSYDAAGNRRRHENDYCLVEISRESRGLAQRESVLIRGVGVPSPVTRTIQREFDSGGRVGILTYPSGRKVRFTYEPYGRIASIRNQSAPSSYPGRASNRNNTLIAEYSFRGTRLIRSRLGNGLETAREHDARGHTFAEEVVRPDGTTLWRVQKLRDASGFTRVEISTIPGGARRRKSFLDSLYRLVHYEDQAPAWLPSNPTPPLRAVQTPGSGLNQEAVNAAIGSIALPVGSHTYEYDLMGNRTQTQEPGAPPFPSLPNPLDQYASVDGVAWSYDSDGNLRSDSSLIFSYDHRNQLVRVRRQADASSVVVYYRDALGRVVCKTTGSDVVFRLHDTASFLEELRPGQHVEFTAGHPVGHIVHAAFGGEDYWLTYDETASPRLITDGSGLDVASPVYRPFGEDESGTLSASDLPFGFAGMWFDTGIPILHSLNRAYRWDVGRFLQRDPIGQEDDMNLYAYSNNNPNDYKDSTGLGKGKAVGWAVRRIGGKLVKVFPIHSYKQAARTFAKGQFDILLRAAKRQHVNQVGRMVISKKNLLNDAAHALDRKLFKEVGFDMAAYRRAGGKLGRPHVQDAGLPGRHIFYGVAGAILVSDEAFAASAKNESIELASVFRDHYPGKSIANNLTLTHHFGEDHWSSWIDWLNPLELVAMGGDLGRWIDRERTKELIGLSLTVKEEGTPLSTYQFDLQGNLLSVGRYTDGALTEEIGGEEFLDQLEDPKELDRVRAEFDRLRGE